MLETIIEKTRTELTSLKEEVKRIYQGYQFGKYLAQDIKQRSVLVAEEISYQFNEIAILLQLGEYHQAWEDVRMQDGNPYSLGIVMYGRTHKKDDEMITAFWNHLKNVSKDLPDPGSR